VQGRYGGQSLQADTVLEEMGKKVDSIIYYLGILKT
jgi:hypothetical protein